MKKIKTLCNWLEETNPTNYKNYISAPPDITSPDQIEEWGSLILKYDNPADASYSQTFQDPFEDWYINPKYINENYWKKYQSMNKLQVEIFS